MYNRWFVSVLLIFTVLIVCIGGVSAVDNISDNQTVSDVGSGSVVSSPQVVNSDDGVVGHENSISDGNQNQILGDSDDGIIINSSADLESVLNDQTVNNTVIYLNNQSFVLNDEYTVEGRNLTFCGGISLDDGKTSIITNLNSSVNNYMMVFSNGNITFKNIIFSDIICQSFMYSNSNITFENVSFINIKTNKNLIYNTGNCTFKDCNFVNSNGTIYTHIGNYSCLLDNCSFDNCDSRIDTNYKPNSSNFNITNSRFNNCNGTLVYGNFNLKNCIINGTNSDDDHSYFSPVMYPDSVVNCTFINNIAYRNGGAIYTLYLNSSIINCTFVNNSALYGGAIYDIGSISNISNCIFVNNSATIAGGAITKSYTDSSIVNNCTFVNNSAGVCGGAILVGTNGTFTVSDSTFSGNNASDYGNDIYYYVSRDGNETIGQLILLNNSEDLELYINNDSAGFITSIYGVVDFGNNTTGFCIEFTLPIPVYYYAYFNNTNLAINVINQEYVGDYLKYLLYNYYGEIPNYILSYAIWSFTNYPYFDSNFLDNITIESFENAFNDNKYWYPRGSSRQVPTFDDPLDLLKYVINDTLNSVDNGEIIPDNGATKLNDDGSYTVYDFDSILSSATQNLITVKTSNLSDIAPDISIIKITNDPVVYKGNDTSFDIVVTNNGTIMLSNVTVTEDSYDDLSFKSWSPITGNWTYNFVNGKHTWTLTGYLGVNQTARFNVVFTTVNSTIGNKTNVVSVTTNENVTGNASNITEVIENNTTNNNTPNTTDNNTPNKPTPVDNKTVENSNTPKADIKTDEATGYPFIPLIIALIGIIGVRTRRK